ncbi:hypothetical protein F4V91_03970 [Neorhizobium galegae]|uniref:Propionyl-coenzyme A carboxylase alpha polypeptide n=1 Tax=Neorhizobium galegae TaxID=399 RepID=A0A6A1TXE6_NEOGA|nr:hypothetical protein F4V91_03970 [Neorhizobium galegae]
MPAISPTGGEIGWAPAHRSTFDTSSGAPTNHRTTACWEATVAPLVISPPVGEMAGRPEGGAAAQPK